MRALLILLYLSFATSFPTQSLRSSYLSHSLHFKRASLITSTTITTTTSLDKKISKISLSSQSTNDTEQQEDQEKEDSQLLIMNTLLTTIGSTTSALVAGTFYAVLAYRRDALMVSFFMGAISNGILSKVLKKVLNQERPAELNESNLKLKPSDGGMPSSHAMSLGFICTFTALNLPSTTIPLIVYVAISLLYRINTKLHTTEQIIVGLTLGTINGYIWRSLCFGTNPLVDVNLMDWVTQNFLNESGLLPLYALSIPAIVGAAVVGSVERRIARFLKNKKKEKEQ